ncbi:MAG: sulfurtransferase, partial [Planctomycetota bacterium]
RDGRTDDPPPLVAAADLKKQLHDPRLRILDTRAGSDYVRGHVRGAVLVDVADWTRSSSTEESLLDEEAWAERLGDLGIEHDSRVVVYGTSWPTAARIWWLLRFQGVRNVRLLDGGWSAWRKVEGPIDNRPPMIDATDFTPRPRIELLATKPEIRHWLQKDSVQIVDARSAEEYRRHIPGAVHIEWTRLIDERGHMRSAANLRTLFRKAGLDPHKPVVAYCRSGARASVMVIGLYRAGFSDVRNYYFSWNDWISPPPGPVETVSR